MKGPTVPGRNTLLPSPTSCSYLLEAKHRQKPESKEHRDVGGLAPPRAQSRGKKGVQTDIINMLGILAPDLSPVWDLVEKEYNL